MQVSTALRSILFRLRPLCTTSKLGYSTANEKWEIHTAVCLERLPILTQPFNELQLKYKAFLDEMEVNNSLKSDHELRHEQDIINAEKLKDETKNFEELEAISKVTAQDFEELSNEELAQFKFGPTVTEADKTNDRKSLSRKLHSHLVLLVEQKLGKDKRFVLPQGKHEEGETLRQVNRIRDTAEKVLKKACGDNVNALFYGNAPCGYMKYKWKDENSKSTGVKLFFYYARHVSGKIETDATYAWSSREEMKNMLAERYHRAISDFLVEERP